MKNLLIMINNPLPAKFSKKSSTADASKCACLLEMQDSGKKPTIIDIFDSVNQYQLAHLCSRILI